jgi:hypothetical protein
MPNLDHMTPPPAPDIGASRPNALAARNPNGGFGQPPQPAPAPTHGETVAALRHFDAIAGEMRALLSSPGVGQSNLKGKIIDAVTKLVQNRILSAPQAVDQLGSVPEAPFQQKQWLLNHYQQSVQAAGFVLDHHWGTHRGIPEHLIDKTAAPEAHMDTMASLGRHYKVAGHA